MAVVFHAVVACHLILTVLLVGAAATCPAPKEASTRELTLYAYQLKKEGAVDDALDCLRRAVEINDAEPNLWLNLGILEAPRNQVEAILHLQKAISMEGASEQVIGRGYAELGYCYQQLGEYKQAIEQFQQALNNGFEDGRMWNSIANVFKVMGRTQDAIAAIERSATLQPSADTYNTWGNIYQDLSLDDTAIEIYRRGIELFPNSPHLYHNLANSYTMHEDVVNAIENYEKALALQPVYPLAFAHYYYYLQFGCIWKQLPTLWPQLKADYEAEIHNNLTRQLSVQAFQALIFPFTPNEIRTVMQFKAKEFYQKISFTVDSLPTYYRDTYRSRNRVVLPARRLRIGYLSSAAFNNHVRAHLIQELFGRLNRHRFEVYCYALTPSDGSAERTRSETACEHFHDVSSFATQSIFRQMQLDEIDILVDLNGHTQGARMEVLALRPAPIQVSHLAFACTTGANYIQYFISDRVSTLIELQNSYVESLVFMPHTYQINSIGQVHTELALKPVSQLPSKQDLGLPSDDDTFIFCNFNHLYKIDPQIFDVWVEIMQRVPNSVLWLLQYPAGAEPNLRAEWKSRNMSDDRILFSPLYPQRERHRHFERSRHCQLFLDTPVYNAHTTASDILWAGVPLVTLPGRIMSARVAASILEAVGLPELIASSKEDYIQKVMSLVSDRELLHSIQSKLERNRFTHPLFDVERWVNNYEKILEMMWDAHTHYDHAPRIVASERQPLPRPHEM